jgi:lipid A oxidase
MFASTTALLTVLSLPLLPGAAAAETELSFYLGAQTAPHSRVEGTDATGPFSFLAAWEGKSGAAPPYYGLRATWWRSENFGYGVELNHAKVYLDDANLAANNFDSFELTDGLNILTANAFYRWPGMWGSGRVTPYVGGGAGVAVPHVDVERNGQKTFEYQMTGVAVVWMAGLSYALNDTWGMFAEYKGTYSANEADLTGGGSFTTDIVTNAINIGVSYKF